MKIARFIFLKRKGFFFFIDGVTYQFLDILMINQIVPMMTTMQCYVKGIFCQVKKEVSLYLVKDLAKKILDRKHHFSIFALLLVYDANGEKDVEMTAQETLVRYFGYDTFRIGQERLIDNILAGRDVLGVMPTGGGKSICFQVPALLLDGVTIVVSPLISLMKDQVNALNQSGIPASFINSTLSFSEICNVLNHARQNAFKLIYVAPERLLTSMFLDFTKSVYISQLAVDEAHCISQWGQDFRPSYAQIPQFIAQLPNRPVVSAFTATATLRVRDDIVAQLALQSPEVLVTSFDRPNLYFEVKKPKDKYFALTTFLQDKRDQNGIVYCSTRDTVEKVCERLKADGYNAARYHAGLSDIERHTNQDDFLFDRVQIMVATNAFGLGIDKSNISFIVHYNMPKDVESYYQEAGRSGRDGEPASCLLLFSGQDVRTNIWLIDNDTPHHLSPSTEDGEAYIDVETDTLLKERKRKRLREMTQYCETSDCLRGYILRYFGENPPVSCGNCGNCTEEIELTDCTIDAQKILSCVYRMRERYGVKAIIDTLRGAKTEKIYQLGFDKLSTYGISEKSEQELKEIITKLLLGGYLIKTDDQYPVIKLGQRAGGVLYQKEQVLLKLSKIGREDAPYSRSKRPSAPLHPVDKQLYATLKNLRMQIAEEQKVPAFVILHDTTLVDMCMKLPTSLTEMAKVSGIGQVKLERYGMRFLQVIKDYTQNVGHTQPPTLPPTQNPRGTFDPTSIEISTEPINVSIIADKINCALLESGFDKINGTKINDWLVSKGYLKVIQINDTNYKVPTESGIALGIICQDRIIRDEPVKMNFFSISAQEFIVQNTMEIVSFKKTK